MSESNPTETHELAQHHDGITEDDNKLPRWWLATLFLAMAFSYVYWQYFHVLKAGPSELQQWAEEKAAHDKALEESGADVNDQMLVQLSKGAAAQAGAVTFKSTCAACHGEHAEGKIGPNLTDNYWLHGGRPTDIYKTVTNGWPLKGMPTWKTTLGPAKIKEVVAYVLTLRGTNVPGKAPEGQEYKPDGAPGAAAPGPAAAPSPSPAGEPHARAGLPENSSAN